MKIKITFKNGFVKIVDKNSVRNFNSLLEWMEKFNNNQEVSLLTMSGRDLGSSFSIDNTNIISIESIKE